MILKIFRENLFFFVPLALFSVYAWGLIFQKSFYFLKIRNADEKFYRKVMKYLGDNDLPPLRNLIRKKRHNPAVELLRYGLEKHEEGAKEALILRLKSLSLSYLGRMENRINNLNNIANTSVSLGLLGTVTGMIRAFNQMSLQNSAEPAVLAQGISQALATTAGGLLAALPSLFFYNVFVELINRHIKNMNFVITEFQSGMKRSYEWFK